MSLVDFLDQLESQEEEMSKVAAEEDAAGRIMARGFMDELNKLAADPFGELDSYMKQKGIKTPKSVQAKSKPVVKPVAQPSRKQILGGSQMGVQNIAAGSSQAKKIQQKAKTLKAPPSAGEIGRSQARETYLRNRRIMQQQQQERY